MPARDGKADGKADRVSINLPDDMALLCRYCPHQFPRGVTMTGAAQHVAQEHHTADVKFELVALCPRCRQPMKFLRTQGNREVFDCGPCHRTRSVSRQHRENL